MSKKHLINNHAINGEEFIDINQQITFLEQRGFKITNKNELAHIITNYGYFRLFHTFIPQFLDNNNRLIAPLTEKDILAIYYFDRNLATLYYQFFGYFEHKLRSNIIIQGNIECPNILKQFDYFYPNPNAQDNIIRIIEKHIYLGATYLKPYHQVKLYPLFIIINFIDLNEAIKMMHIFKDKTTILKNFYFDNEKDFLFVCNNIMRLFRNATAHYDRMYRFFINLDEEETQQLNNILLGIIKNPDHYQTVMNHVINNNYNTFILTIFLVYLLSRSQAKHFIYQLNQLLTKGVEEKIPNFNFINDMLTNQDAMNWPANWLEILKYITIHKTYVS
ncbi:Abi family protein [Spiroplasma chrysopicola]|uniref:Abortive infection bacteriophage resistance protein n=1 Tax=Spiroplasma chrysopicola DF-1 TaxID=1276227 RepID=R4UI16_9MOLU|nr:Abi family protein [Spiroplasma chrysopicola]AGM24961.1 hypothetical protein SCHRY_v1c03780 [Spiroplasma chrysopicola DF-1]